MLRGGLSVLPALTKSLPLVKDIAAPLALGALASLGDNVVDKIFGEGMVRTSKTDHFFKLAPFWSPLTDLIDFGMAGKLLTSATR